MFDNYLKGTVVDSAEVIINDPNLKDSGLPDELLVATSLLVIISNMDILLIAPRLSELTSSVDVTSF